MNCWEVGAVISYLHDIADIFTCSSRFLGESNYKNWINEQETFSDLIAKQENDKLKTTLIAKNND